MTYTFSCPAPCKRVVCVEAQNDEHAIEKLIEAGALACRNKNSRDLCKEIHKVMQPLPNKQLREFVGLQMRFGDLAERKFGKG
jgi:DNA polymerase III alpha subunit